MFQINSKFFEPQLHSGDENAIEPLVKTEVESTNVRIPLAPINLNSSIYSPRVEVTPTKKASLAPKLLAWDSSSKYPPKEPPSSAANIGGDNLVRDLDGCYMTDRITLPGPVAIVSPPRFPEPSAATNYDSNGHNPRRQLVLVEEEAGSDVYVPAHNLPPRECESVELAFDDDDDENENVFGAAGIAWMPDEVEVSHRSSSGSEERTLIMETSVPFVSAPVTASAVGNSSSRSRRSSVGFQLASNKEALRALSRRRVSMELCLGEAYDDSVSEGPENCNDHQPLYSQAELDALVKEARRELQLEMQRLVEEVQMLRKEARPEAKSALSSNQSTECVVEELAMQKIQIRALTLEVKNLQEELLAKSRDHDAQLVSMRDVEATRVAQAARRANMEALEKTAVVVRECETRLGAMREDLLQSEADRSQLSEELAALRVRLAAAEAEKASAVEEVRAKLYEKAQRQFEEGNKEYQRALRELKENKQQCERACQDAAMVRAEAAATGHALEKADATCRALMLELDSVKNSVAKVLRLTTGAVPREDILGSLQDHEVYLSSQLKLIADLEAAVGSSATAVEEAGRRLQAEAAARESAEEAHVAVSALYSATQQQVAALEAERATNLALIARLVTSKDKFECELERLREDLQTSNERCISLRAMNEELLGMLEGGVHAT